MANDARPTCETCRFWERDVVYEFELHHCFRHAPRDDGGYSGSWPKTTADKWCGEHEPRAADDEGTTQHWNNP
jgi:hypothetical protein